MLNGISSNSYILEKALDASWKRNEVQLNNIANVDTPNFKRSTVNFEDELNKVVDKNQLELSTSNERHFTLAPKQLSISVNQDNKELQYRLDGNNVDIEVEMADLAKNSIRYNTLIQKISEEYKRQKYVISEGKR